MTLDVDGVGGRCPLVRDPGPAPRGTPLTLAVDASIAAAWLLPDEGAAATDRWLDQRKVSCGVAPPAFRHMMPETPSLAERCERIDSRTASILPVGCEGLASDDGGPGTGLPPATLDRALAP